MRNDFKEYWINEYTKVYAKYLDSYEYDYDKGILFGRCLALASVLTLEYGFCTLAIEADLEKRFNIRVSEQGG